MPPRKQPGSGPATKKAAAPLPVEEAFDLDGHEFSDIDLEADTSTLVGTGTSTGAAQKTQSASKPAAARSKATTSAKAKTAPAAATFTFKKSATKKKSQARSRDDDDDGDASMVGAEEQKEDGDDDDVETNIEDQKAEIPRDLLTRILHGFFAKENTRITASANDAVAAYLDTFVREAIVRASDEGKSGAFLEVEDLEKVGPQLLLDL